MQLLRVRGAAAVLMLLAAHQLAGQSGTIMMLGGGVSLPSGEFHSYAGTGWSALAGVERRFGAHPTALRFDVAHSQDNDSTAIGFHESTKFTTGLVSLAYHFDGSHPHVYAFAGAGAIYRTFKSDDPDEIPIYDTHGVISVGEGIGLRLFGGHQFIEGRFVTTVGPGPFRYFTIVGGAWFGAHRP